MACLNPLQVYSLNKGEKVKFKKYSNIDVAKSDMNNNYESNNSVSCRKCDGCKLDNAKEWAIRSALECKSSKDNWFITLTYSDEFVPVSGCWISSCEEILTCRYFHLRRFVESLRQVFTRRGVKDIKYLASSEYGSRTNRPHYHLCFFNLPLDGTLSLLVKCLIWVILILLVSW